MPERAIADFIDPGAGEMLGRGVSGPPFESSRRQVGSRNI